MLSEQRQRQIILQEPKFVKKLQRMEALSIQLNELLGYSKFTLGKSSRFPEGQWRLDVGWNHNKTVFLVRLQKRVKGWVHRNWESVMTYHRYGTDSRKERRELRVFDDSVVAVLDKLSDELEKQIIEGSRAIQKCREQFRQEVENHPREERSRFDNIDPRP